MSRLTSAYSLTTDPGLLTTLAAQADLTEVAQQHLQQRALGFAPPARPMPRAQPLTGPGGDSWGYNVQAFLRLLDHPCQSRNAYNARRAELLALPVLAEGWTAEPPLFGPLPTPPPPAAWPLAPGRGGLEVNETLLSILGLVLRAVGYDRQAPVLLDREGRVMDGFHRLLVCTRLGLRAYFVQLDC